MESKKPTSNEAENGNKSKPLLADVIINRLKKNNIFSYLSECEVKKICKSFEDGFFYTNQCIRPTFIRPKNEKLDLNYYSDSDIVFWCCRILEKPLFTIVV